MSHRERRDVCGVCGEWLPEGCTVREVVSTGDGDGLYGHPKCVDGEVKRLMGGGASYLGDIDLRR